MRSICAIALDMLTAWARIYIISSLSVAKTYRICCKANISSWAKRWHIDKIKIASVDTEAVLIKKKGREILAISRPFFLTSTASVSTEAILIFSICRRYARLDIFACNKFDMFSLRSNSIWYKSALTQWAYRVRQHISNASVYIENPH